jgi:hypothetical protein
MVELNEVEKSGNGRIAKFRPLVDKTIDGQILKDAAKLKMLAERESEEKKKTRASKDEPWRTVHIGGKEKAIPNQGGQSGYSTLWRRPNGSVS